MKRAVGPKEIFNEMEQLFGIVFEVEYGLTFSIPMLSDT
jgi:hypothetical protein